MRVLITGSRRWPVKYASAIHIQLTAAWVIATNAGETLTVGHGACPTGADAIADRWARSRGIATDPNPADWDLCAPDCPPGHRKMKRPRDIHHPGKLPDYCPDAGPRRNRATVAKGADRCAAFLLPNSFGTWNCIRLAEAAGTPTRRIRPDGAGHERGGAA